MNGMPDFTDQQELLKKFIEEGRPATPEAIAGVVEAAGGRDYFRKTYRAQTPVAVGLLDTPRFAHHLLAPPQDANPGQF
jgi:hypothetical protein